MEDEVVEPMYYEQTCNKCGQIFNYDSFVWNDMVFCSESCMNREKEYWYDVEQLKEQYEEKL